MDILAGLLACLRTIVGICTFVPRLTTRTFWIRCQGLVSRTNSVLSLEGGGGGGSLGSALSRDMEREGKQIGQSN